MKLWKQKWRTKVTFIYNFIFFFLFYLETGEVITKSVEKPKKSFFNFFSNVKVPSKDEINSYDFEHEKELGPYLDSEFENGLEFIEEFIPHATDYFLGLKPEDNDEFTNYLDSQAKIHKQSI